MRKQMAIVITLLFMVAIFPGIVQAAEVSLNLDMGTVKVGDNVTASGSASPDTWVSVKVLDSNHSIVFFDAVKSDATGKYSLGFQMPEVPEGNTTVVAGYGTNVASKKLNVGQESIPVIPEQEGDNVTPGKPGGGDTTTPPPVSTPSAGGGGSNATPQVNAPVNQAVEVVKEGQAEKTPGQSTFVTLNDISNNWAAPHISKLAATGAINGYPDGSFKPDNTISRAEFVTVLIKAFNLELKGGKVFNDTANHWAKDYISTAVANGIVSGYSDATFGAGDFITREQMAAMIVKAAKLTAVTGGNDFADNAEISPWAMEAITVASSNGIISGYQDNTFKPQGHATRAEAATVVVKALK